MRIIGLHLRLGDSLVTLAERAIALEISTFQCFLMHHDTNKLHQASSEEIKQFVALREQHFGNLFVHGSYWINLASITHTTHYALERECTLAKKLAFTHIVLHCGSAKGARDRMAGIDALARSLNTFFAQEKELACVLENSAHGGMSIGSDIADFALLLEKIDKPERVFFCIDTSHAYAFGYDIKELGERERFITLLRDTLGLHRIILLHVNDTKHELGSQIDQHLIPGDGAIGENALKAFVLHENLKSIPIIVEPPPVGQKEEQKILEKIRSWH